jgi:hypothetical protein
MKCQRCLSGEEATCRVRSDVIDMKVCAVCADEARRLRLTVEALGDEGRRGTGEKRERERGPGFIFCLSARGEGVETSISVILSCWMLSVGHNSTNSLGIGTQ